MATYNKRGFKAPKTKEEVEKFENEFEEVNEKDSTTAEVFNTLDQTASKTEEWVARNQKNILIVVGAIALLTAGYLLYNKFIVDPKEDKARNEMFMAQKFFKDALDGTKADSLFNLALKGGEGKMGFEKIIENYAGTKSANLAHYYAGMAYYNLKDYKKAVSHLEEFTSSDEFLQPLAFGTIGDAFSELKKHEEALKFYKKAAEASTNDFTTPRFLLKHGQLALANGKKAEALESFKTIKEKYETSPEGVNIDALIAMLE